MYKQSFTCAVCGKDFNDPYEHIIPKNNIRDAKHDEYVKALADGNYTKACFCGGHVGWYGNEMSYEVRCNSCDFLYDED